MYSSIGQCVLVPPQTPDKLSEIVTASFISTPSPQMIAKSKLHIFVQLATPQSCTHPPAQAAPIVQS